MFTLHAKLDQIMVYDKNKIIYHKKLFKNNKNYRNLYMFHISHKKILKNTKNDKNEYCICFIIHILLITVGTSIQTHFRKTVGEAGQAPRRVVVEP